MALIRRRKEAPIIPSKEYLIARDRCAGHSNEFLITYAENCLVTASYALRTALKARSAGVDPQEPFTDAQSAVWQLRAVLDELESRL